MASLVVADASEYLAITGGFDTTPVNYEFEVHATTLEKLSLILPMVLTVGPKVDEHSKAYSKLIIAPHGNDPPHVGELVRGAVEGQARALAASMTAEEISQGAESSFEQAVVEKVQLELDHFGLFIHNANVSKQFVAVHKVDVQVTKVEAEALENERDDAVVVAAAAKANLEATTKMPAWVLASLFIASAAVTLVVYEAPPGVGKGAYYLAVSGAFFAAVAGVMAAVVAAN